jgi:hypothetical protein
MANRARANTNRLKASTQSSHANEAFVVSMLSEHYPDGDELRGRHQEEH